MYTLKHIYTLYGHALLKCPFRNLEILYILKYREILRCIGTVQNPLEHRLQDNNPMNLSTGRPVVLYAYVGDV